MRYIVVGTGNISNVYVAALAQLPSSELVGCVSRSGRHLPAAPELPCWNNLAAVDCDFDAVILCTPNGLHHEGAIAAAHLGKHVLTEKPLAITIDSMDEMTRACAAEDHGAAILQHENGMIGTVVASTAARPGFAARLEVHCEKGRFTLTDDVISFWDVDGVDNPTDPKFHYAYNGATSAAVTDTSAHQAVLLDFEAAIRSGCEPLASAQSARLTTELILKIYHANTNPYTI